MNQVFNVWLGCWLKIKKAIFKMLKDWGNFNVKFPATKFFPRRLFSFPAPILSPFYLFHAKFGVRQAHKRRAWETGEEGRRGETQPCQIFVHLVPRKRSPSFCGRLIAPDWRPLLPSHDLHLRHRRSRLFNVCGGPQQLIAHTLADCTTAALSTIWFVKFDICPIFTISE